MRQSSVQIEASLRGARAGSLHLAIVIPTLNESSNILPLLDRLERALEGFNWEVIFVDDDSTDGTAEHIRQIALIRPNIRVLERIGRRGLASACIEGMLATAAPYIAVMDADLQHDESILPQMLELAQENELDLVVGSRNVEGGSMGTFSPYRRWLSNTGKRLSQFVCRCPVQDPMSGFFIVDRRFLKITVRRLSAVGFKILVDLLASSPRMVRMAEVPYQFRNRLRGESKLDSNTMVDYVMLLADKLTGGRIPLRFVLFGTVGLIGVAVHLLVLYALFINGHAQFLLSQAVATLAAMTFNFLVNNSLTYRDMRLSGWRLAAGLLSFYIACGIGAVSNVALAEWLYRNHVQWYAAGALGTVISAVWNYAVTSVFVWRTSQRYRRREPENERSAIPQTKVKSAVSME